MSPRAPRSACPKAVRNLRRVSTDSSALDDRELCGICFFEVALEDVDKVLVGRYNTRVHLDDSHEINQNPHTSDDEDEDRTVSTLYQKIGSEDFEPGDLDELSGGEA